jgi:hypothetical protein
MPTMARLRTLFVPACIGLLFLVAGGWYYSFWIPTRHRYLDDRNFRVLQTLSEQIRLSVDNFDRMLDNAADAGVKSDNLKEYLANVAPQLEAVDEKEGEEVIHNDFGDPPKVAIAADEGTHYLYIAFQRDVNDKRIKYAVRADLDKLVKRLVPPDNRNPFDDVLLAQNDGSVIFQKSTLGTQRSTPGIEVARIDAFEDENGALGKPEDAKTEKPESGSAEKHARPDDKKQLSQSSSFRAVTLAGAQYRLYSQPLRLSFPPIAAEARAKEIPRGSLGEQWILCGLVRADNFRAESQWMSYTYILWFLGAILLAVAAYPFLRLRLSSQTERLRPRDVVSTALLTCFATAVVTFILLDLYYGRDQCEQSGERRADRQMLNLASAIDSSFEKEKEHAFNQLTALTQMPDLLKELQRAQTRLKNRPRLSDHRKDCEPESACRVDILHDKIPDGLHKYPYLQYISWSDENADQQIKWTTRPTVTPFINLAKESYYADVQKALTDLKKAQGDRHYTASIPFEGIASQYSSNTGKNITIFWKLVDAHGKSVLEGLREKASHQKEVSHEEDVFCVSLVSYPISVMDPILPAGFKFAVIRNDGTVVFHSDATRNLRENFFNETDQDQDLRSRVSMRSEGSLVTNYMGKRQRLYVRPMSSSAEQNWSVVVFRDVRLEETLNLEILSLSSVMFLSYAACIALVLLLVHWSGAGRGRGKWLWPDSRQAVTYRILLAANAVAALALCVLPRARSFWILFSAAVVIPISAMLLNFFFFRRRKDSASPKDATGNGGSGWQLSYVLACAILLLVVAVLPCVSFVKVACDFEHKLFTQRNLLGLASDLENRMAIMRKRYEKADLGSYASQLLAEVRTSYPADPATNKGLDQQDTEEPVFSYHKALNMTICTGDACNPTDRVQIADPRPLSWQSSAELLLSKLTPSYNDLAADDHYLAQATLHDRRWLFYVANKRQEDNAQEQNKGREQVELVTGELDGTERTIASAWTPLHIPWSGGLWWVGASLFLGILFGLVSFMLRAIFLLDLEGTDPDPSEAADLLSPDSLNAKPKANLLVIDSGSSKTLANLCAGNGWIESRNMEDLLKVPQQSAMTSDGTTVPISDQNPVERIVRLRHPVLLYGVEKVLRNPETSAKSRVVVREVLRQLDKSVVLSTVEDPVANACDGEMEHWRALLRSFIRVELGSEQVLVPRRAGRRHERRVTTDPYHRWLFDQQSESEKLLLVQLAQEGLVNPNSRGFAQELIRKGLIIRRSGLLSIRNEEFAMFLKHAVSSSTTKRWETEGAGITTASLRFSLLVIGAGVAGFLIYTQGEVFNTWVTYATGFAASVPTFLHLFSLFRGGKASEPA